MLSGPVSRFWCHTPILSFLGSKLCIGYILFILHNFWSHIKWNWQGLVLWPATSQHGAHQSAKPAPLPPASLYTALFLFNPIVVNVSTRGNADCLVVPRACWGVSYNLLTHFQYFPPSNPVLLGCSTFDFLPVFPLQILKSKLFDFERPTMLICFEFPKPIRSNSHTTMDSFCAVCSRHIVFCAL